MEEAIIVNTLEKCRREKGVSRKDAADAINVSQKTMERYECGDALPRIDTVLRLCAYYDKSVDQLYQLKSTDRASQKGDE